ncbi:VCBS repeat-containing protein [Streptomyces sp. NPDC002888]|uniref:VCBS repeat-containing protein n=1 Tax=Streptomyces sp. NPDC002888 TaxID=3364668 RepID=UPI0036A8930F
MAARATLVGVAALLLTAGGLSGSPAGAPALAAATCTGGVNPDYNGDGIRDVAIADPEATVAGSARAGHIDVVYGGGKGTKRLDQSLAEVPGSAEAGDQFGFSMATFDVNEDGCDDLAVGIPHEAIGTALDAGGAAVIYGSPDGLGQGIASAGYDQGLDSVPGAAEAGDWFGYSVAAGTSGGKPFLIIGSPGEDIGTPSLVDAGSAVYLRDGKFTDFSQDTAGVPGVVEKDDRFGAQIAATATHFAVSTPGEAIGTDTFAGGVAVFGHTFTDGKPTALAGLDQDGTLTDGSAISGGAEPSDSFGKALAMVPFRASGTGTPTESLLIVGVPGEDLPADADAGIVQVFKVTAAGAVSERPGMQQDLPGIEGASEPGDLFGERLAAVNISPNTAATASTVLLAVGVPGEDIGDDRDAGAVQTFPLVGEPGDGDVWIEQGEAGIGGDVGPQEYFGTGLGATTASLYLGVPYGPAADRAVYGLPWANVAPGGTAGTVQAWRPGEGGIPADGVTSFGAVIR